MDVAAQAEQLWSMLDDMSASDPEGYHAFVQQQLQEGAVFYSPPEPQYCLHTQILEPEKSTLYINVCSWKRVPPPDSLLHPVPVCGGRLGKGADGQESYYVLDVAFNPMVLQAERDERWAGQLPPLAMRLAERQHGLHLSQCYTVAESCLKGSMRGLRERLVSSWQSITPDAIPTGPELLQQISLLRGRADDPPVVATPSQHCESRAPPLIQVISSTEMAQLRQPKHELTLSDRETRRVCLMVHLPGVRSASECQLSVSQDDILLQVEDLYQLHLELPAAVREEEVSAVFSKKRQMLSVSLPLL